MKMLYCLPVVASLLVAGCTSDSSNTGPAAGAAMDESVPQVARTACLREVARVTNNPSTVILEMLYSEANSQVTVGVGPDRARWQCTVSKSGVVANVMSLTNEGAL